MTDVPVSANPGVGGGTAASTVIATVAVWVRLADFPVTVTVYDPAVVAASVLTVSTAVTELVPEIAAGCAAEQVGGLDAPAGPDNSAGKRHTPQKAARRCNRNSRCPVRSGR